MDIKITGARFKNLLSYEWVKIIVGIIVGIVVWSLLFTTLGTRITVGEQFYFVTYENVFTTDSNNSDNKLLSDMKKNGVFSYDVLDVSVNKISSAGQYSASYMLSLRVTTQEGDVLLISDGRATKVDENGKDKNGKIPSQEIESVINHGYVFDFETFLNRARSYCVDNGFIIENTDGSYTVNEDEIEKYFLTERITSARNYKRTYRTAEQKAQGVKNEIARIKAIYENYLYVDNAVKTAKENGNDFLWYGTINQYDENGEVIEGKGEEHPFGIDLYKLNQPFISSKLKVEDRWFTYADEKTTCEGLVLSVFNFESHQPDLQYESLAFIKSIIETYSGY